MAALSRAALRVTGHVELDDRELVARSAAGDAAAFESIYRRYAERVFALLTRLIGPDREREDLLQDVFIRLHPALTRFRGDCSLLTLIYRIAARVAVDHMRRRRPALLDQLDDEIDPSLAPEAQAIRREQIARALALLARLSPKHRVAFVLHEAMGLSHVEIGRILESHPAAVRMRVAAARRKLAALTAREDQP